MSRQDANAAFARTSFLSGGNARYVEDLQRRYAANPESVGAEWQVFFQSLKADGGPARDGEGPSWKKPNWPLLADGEILAALSGDWSGVEKDTAAKIKGRVTNPPDGMHPAPMLATTVVSTTTS